MKLNQRVFGPGLLAAILVCYLLSAVILGTQVGPWEAVRQAVVNGFLAAGWLFAVHRILGEMPIPELPAIKRPAFELALLLLSLLVMASLAADRYGVHAVLPNWLYYLVSYGVVLGLFVLSGYGARGLGLSWLRREGWLTVSRSCSASLTCYRLRMA